MQKMTYKLAGEPKVEFDEGGSGWSATSKVELADKRIVLIITGKCAIQRSIATRVVAGLDAAEHKWANRLTGTMDYNSNLHRRSCHTLTEKRVVKLHQEALEKLDVVMAQVFDYYGDMHKEDVNNCTVFPGGLAYFNSRYKTPATANSNALNTKSTKFN